MRDIGPQFTEDGLCRDGTDAGDVGQIDAEDPGEFSPEIERFQKQSPFECLLRGEAYGMSP